MDKKSKTKIDLAWEFYRKDDLDKTSKLCRSILNVKKYALEANYLLGLIAYNNKDFKKALEYFSSSLTLDINKKAGGFLNYWIGRTYEYSEFWGNDDNPIYNEEKANEAYNESLNFDKFPPDSIFKVIKHNTEVYKKIELYKKGIEKFKDEADFYIYLWKLYHNQGYELKKLEILELAISSGIKSSSLLFNLGQYYFEEEEYATSLKFFLDCLSICDDSNSSIIYYSIGNCYYKLGKIDSASSSFYKGYELESDQRKWFFILELILIYKEQKKSDETIKLFKKIPLDRNLFEYLNFDFGLTTYLDGRTMERAEFQNAKEIEIILSNLYKSNKDKIIQLKIAIILAEVYGYLTDDLSKFKILRENLHGLSTYPFFENNLSEAYCSLIYSETEISSITNNFLEDMQGHQLANNAIERISENLINKLFKEKNYQKVVLICDKLLESQLEKIGLTFKFAYSLGELKRPKDAKIQYEKYLEIDFNSSAALNNLAIIYREEGNYEKALSLLKDAIKYGSETELYQNNLKTTINQWDKKKQEEKEKKIPEGWKSSIKNISLDNLEEIGYFSILSKIDKINKKYRTLIERDFKELVFNYLVGNNKSTIVISGSLLEMILTYYCEKKKLLMIQIKDGKGNIQSKKLYDCVLIDLITFVESKKLFGNDFNHLGNLSRIYRNFIHPGLELKSKADIKPKANLCFISSLEILKKIIS